MNNAQVTQLISEIESLKKEAIQTLQDFKENKITQNEALVKSKLLDVANKIVATTVTLDGIRLAIEYRLKESKPTNELQSNKGKQYQKVSYR